METIDEVRDLLSGRLELLTEEQRKIERALQELGDKRRRKPRRKRSDAGKPRGRRGGRRNDVLRIVKANPGITGTEVARKLSIKPNYLYRIIGELAAEKLIVKDGRKLSLKQ